MFNEDVRTPNITDMFSILNMHEAIIQKHGTNGPGTGGGPTPIDAIFCSTSIEVQAAGYTTFSWGHGSNHRLLWIDIHERQFYGGQAPPMWQPKARKLKTDDPRIVDRYVERKLEELAKLNAIPRLCKLYADFESNATLSTANRRELNHLDVIRSNASATAEARCRRIKKGNVPWSPALQAAINKIRYYRACIRRYRYNTNVNSRTLVKLHKKQTGPLATNLEAPEANLRAAMSEYKTAKPNAAKLRYTHLADLAQAQADTTEADHSTVLAQLLHREEQRRLGQKLRSIQGNNRQGVTSIEAQSPT